jgi:pilus assembly protein CpaB
LPPIIPPGKRALSVRVNEVIGVAGYVLPGTRVDVVATANPTSKSEDITTKVVLQNVEVLAAGTRLDQDTPDGKPMQVTVVTLLVTPEESERLALASTEGKIQLALRNPMDTATLATPGVKPGILLGMSQPRSLVVRKPLVPGQPAPPPPPPPSVEVIKGDKRSQVVVG